MSGGAPGVGYGPTQPFTIKEAETQGINEVTKKYVLSMVLDSIAEAIPFTQREYDEVFKYRSEADRPTLHALMHLRFAGAEPYGTSDEKWQTAYQELFDSLPENVKGWVTWEMNLPFAERDPSYVIVSNVLTAAAKALVLLSAANQPIQPNTRTEQNYLLNVALPYVALRGILSQSETILNRAEAWVDTIGANDPYHDSLINLLSQVGNALNKLDALRRQEESGNNSPEVKQQFIESAYEFDRLRQLVQTTPIGDNLRILGASLDALATLSAAFALESGSPSLLLGIAAASIGLTSDTSSTGIFGNSYSKAVDSLMEGILSALVFGPRSQLEELTDLYNELTGLG